MASGQLVSCLALHTENNLTVYCVIRTTSISDEKADFPDSNSGAWG